MDTAIIHALAPLAPWVIGFSALAILGWVLAPLVLWRTPRRKVEDVMRPVGGWGVGAENEETPRKREHN